MISYFFAKFLAKRFVFFVIDAEKMYRPNADGSLVSQFSR